MSVRAESSTLARMGALARRDLRIFLTYRLQLLMTVASGVTLVLGLFFMDRVVADSPALGPYRGRYFEFALLGVLLLSFVSVGLGAFRETLSYEQRTGTLEMMLTTPNRLATLVGGMFSLPLAKVALTMVVYLGVAVGLLGADLRLAGVAPGLVLLALIMAIFCAIGAMSAALTIVTKRGDPIGILAMQAATVLGGAVFPITVLPEWLQVLARLLPPYYGLRGLRAVLIGDSGFADILTELAVLTGFAAVLVPASLWLFARAIRHARVTGTLGTY